MAQKYRKIDPRIWDDEKFADMDPTEKLVALNIVTGQSNRCGIFKFSTVLAAEQTGIPTDSYAIAFRKVCHAFNWRYDEQRRVLYIPTWFKYNHPENPKHLKGCLQDLHDVPQTALLADFAKNTAYLSPNLHDTFRIATRIAIPKGMAYQEQEQEQEDISAHDRDNASDSGVGSKHQISPTQAPQPSPGFDRFWAVWPPHKRKTAKDKCWKLWRREQLDRIATQIIESLQRYKQSQDWTKEGGEYIPSPHRWLNEKRWDVPAEAIHQAARNGEQRVASDWHKPVTTVRRATI